MGTSLVENVAEAEHGKWHPCICLLLFRQRSVINIVLVKLFCIDEGVWSSTDTELERG